MAIIIGLICGGIFSYTGYMASTCQPTCPRGEISSLDLGVNYNNIKDINSPVTTKPAGPGDYYARPDITKF